MRPRVSICIPAYGRPRELGEGIASVLAQDFQDFEVVVGDDSGDLEDVVCSFGDPRVRYHRNARRLGMAANWTAVLDRAEGELVGLLMDDDRLLPGFIRSVVERFDSDPSAGIVFANHLFDVDGQLVPRECTLAGGSYRRFLAHYLEHMPVSVSAALMRREVWGRLRPLPPLKTSDVVMHVTAAEEGVVFHYVEEPLMVYRHHAGQLSEQLAFRDDVVAAWEMFEFDDPHCERLRRHRLREALVARGAARLRERRFGDAKGDLERARGLDGEAARPRERAIALLARHPVLATPVISAFARLRSAQQGT
jgi:hypothetical protein